MTQKTLIIAKNPSATKEIANAMGATTRKEGYFDGNTYMVKWATKHLISLKETPEYMDEWKRWNLATFPMLPARYEFKVVDTAKKQFIIYRLSGATQAQVHKFTTSIVFSIKIFHPQKGVIENG